MNPVYCFFVAVIVFLLLASLFEAAAARRSFKGQDASDAFSVGQRVCLTRNVRAMAESAYPFHESGTLEDSDGYIDLECGMQAEVCGLDLDGFHVLVKLRPAGEVLRVGACFLEGVTV